MVWFRQGGIGAPVELPFPLFAARVRVHRVVPLPENPAVATIAGTHLKGVFYPGRDVILALIVFVWRFVCGCSLLHGIPCAVCMGSGMLVLRLPVRDGRDYEGVEW